MKIELQSASTSHTADVPLPYIALIQRLKAVAENDDNETFIEELNKTKDIQTILGKTELMRWAEILNRCDDILADANEIVEDQLKVDSDETVKRHTIAILRFTGMLFECTSSRRVYSSTDRILPLLKASDMDIVAEALRLLQVMSKRSKYLTQKLCPQDQQCLVSRLTAIAQCWGGKLRNVKMEECVKANMKLPQMFPFKFTGEKGHTITVQQPEDDVPLLRLVDRYVSQLDEGDAYCLLARLRLLRGFSKQEHRIHCLIVRLLAITTLIYSRCQPDEGEISNLIYQNFVEEAAALLRVDLKDHPLIDTVQMESLRTLCSIVTLDRPTKLAQILEGLGATSYHGFLAVFTRKVVEDLKANRLGEPEHPSVAMSTALFSLIYHVSSVETGGETLVSGGLMQTLISVIASHSIALEHITFATRCTRIIDILTSVDVTGFNNCKGMDVCIARLVNEVNECRKEQSFVITPPPDVDFEKNPELAGRIYEPSTPSGRTCHQQRSGLIKALLTFIKRAIGDNQLIEATRHIMETDLPDALIHILSNADYYSASLYHQAVVLVSNYVYQDPAVLRAVQKRNIPYVMLQSMLRKELPNSRDVIGYLVAAFTALCFNAEGLAMFKAYDPFNHLFKIVLSVKFIVTMKKKRSEMSETASSIGSSLEELIRHQASLKPLMLDSLLSTLEDLLNMGQNPPPNVKFVMGLSRTAGRTSMNSQQPSGANSPEAERPEALLVRDLNAAEAEYDYSDEDEGDDAEMSMDEGSNVNLQQDKMGLERDVPSENGDGMRLLPLGDYLMIFAKIVETIITQPAIGDMVDTFVERNGIEKLLRLCEFPIWSSDVSQQSFLHGIANIVKYAMQHIRNGSEKLTSTVMKHFYANIRKLAIAELPATGGSMLMSLGKEEIISSINHLNNAIPVLSALTRTTHGAQNEVKNRIWEAWLSETGEQLHEGLRKVSRVLAWETALTKVIEPTKANISTQTEPCDESEVEVEIVDQQDERGTPTPTPNNVRVEVSTPVPHKQRPALWDEAGVTAEEIEFWQSNRSLVEMVTRGSKSLSDFLNLLVRSCYVPQRRSRRYDYGVTPLSRPAQQVADKVFEAIYQDLKWSPTRDAPMEFGRICEVLGQLSSVLFDERRQPYHAMLQKFYTTGCHQAFCEIAKEKLIPALGTESNQLLESAFSEWFRLANRLANKHNMLNSNYRLPPAQAIDFDPEKYLRLIYLDFFRVFTSLFAKLSSEEVNLKNYQNLCESAISVYKEVAPNLHDTNEDKEKEGALNNGDAAALVNPDHIRQLVEMGFGAEEAAEALLECTTVAAAADYLLLSFGRNQQQRAQDDRNALRHEPFGGALGAAAAAIAAAAANAAGGDPQLMAQQIAEELQRQEGQPPVEAAPAPPAPEGRAVDEEMVPEPSAVQMDDEQEASSSRATAGGSPDSTVSTKAKRPVITPLNRLELQSDASISKACIELMPLCKRLMSLGSELVFSCADLVISVVDSLDVQWRREKLIGEILTNEVIEMTEQVITKKDEALIKVLPTRIHFVCLLFEHVAQEYTAAITEHHMVPSVIKLLGFIYDNIDANDTNANTDLLDMLSPVLLWLDLYEKCERGSRRRELLKNVTKALKWMHESHEDRFAGNVRTKKWIPHPQLIQNQLNRAFFDGKDKCTFKMQRRDREVSVDFVTMMQTDGAIQPGVGRFAVCAEIPEHVEVDMEMVAEEERRSVWSPPDANRLLVLVTSLLHKGITHFAVAHSLLSFVARLTRDSECAASFMQQGGVQAMFQLRSTTTPSTSSLMSLILRHCIDDETILGQVMDRSLKLFASNHGTQFAEFLGITADNKVKDWNQSMNKLAPLMARNPKLFAESIDRVVKMEGSTMVLSQNKTPPLPPATNERAQQIVNLILTECLDGDFSNDPCKAISTTRIVTRASLLNLLAELVKTYPSVAGLVCEAKHEGHSVIFSLIDTYIDGKQDKEIATSIKTLVAILATCSHSPKAQESLVSDIKACFVAIGNGAAVPTTTSATPETETNAKSESLYSKVTELCSLVTMMVDSYSSTTPIPKPAGGANANQQQTPNAITKLFHKKKVCNDLIKTITYLNLSQKDAVEAVNHILKTLDTLMRNMNQSTPTGVVSSVQVPGSADHRSLEVRVQQVVRDLQLQDHDVEMAEILMDQHEVMQERRRLERALHDANLGPHPNEDDTHAHDRDHNAEEDEDEDDDDGESSMSSEDQNEADEPHENDHEDGMEDDAVEDSISSDSDDDEDDDGNEAAAADDTMHEENAGAEGQPVDGDENEEGAEAPEADDEQREHEEETAEEDEEDEDDEDMYDYPEDDEDLDTTQDDIAMFDEFLMDRPPGVMLDRLADELEIVGGGIGGIGGIGVNREAFASAARRELNPAAGAQHPLLVRRALGSERANIQPRAPIRPGVGGPYRLLVAHDQHNHPLVGVGIGHHHNHGGGGMQALTRQNAIRRITNATNRLRTAANTTQLFERLFELGAPRGGGVLGGAGDRPAIINFMAMPFQDTMMMDSPEERRLRRPVPCVNALERLTDTTQMMDPLSVRYLAAIVNSFVTRAAKKKADAEKAAADAAKEANKVLLERKQGVADLGVSSSQVATMVDPPRAEMATSTSGGEVITTVAPGITMRQAEITTPHHVTVRLSPQLLPVQQPPADEPMDTTVSQDVDDVSMDEAPTQSSAATAASSIPDDQDEVMVTPPEEPATEASTSQRDGGVDAGSVAAQLAADSTTATPSAAAAEEPAAPPPKAEIPEEFRAILGDIEIPDGVDPAFLAALPEDMRAEVIRDHQRQQRAQRATAPTLPTTTPAAGTSGASGSGEAAAAPPAAPLVEPIDQEFLAALPPELQEEILAQHERAVREAQEALDRANAPPPPPQPEMDGAAVIASLPAGERQQVLAEMDDAELQRLPQEMQDEARRARVHHFDPMNMLRYHRILLPRSGRGGPGRGQAPVAPTVGAHAGQALVASTASQQLIDKESILNLCMLFLADSRLSVARLQKVIRNICSHAPSCDFVIWCLLSILDKASNSTSDDEDVVSVAPNWLHSITISGVGHNERVLKVAKNASSVSIHSLVAPNVCRNVLDTLCSIARAYPGHFIPAQLRNRTQPKDSAEKDKEASTDNAETVAATPSKERSKDKEFVPPPHDQFWQLVLGSHSPRYAWKDSAEGKGPMRFETSPLSSVLAYFNRPMSKSNAVISERLLKLASVVVQTLPDDTMKLMNLGDDDVPLAKELKAVVEVMTNGKCGIEGSNDGRTFVVELMRAMPPRTADFLFDHFFSAVESVGKELQPQVEQLLKELGHLSLEDDAMDEGTSSAPSTSGTGEKSRKSQAGKYDARRVIIDGDSNAKLMMGASSCAELQLPAVMQLTEKSGAQYLLLSALQTLVKIRDTIRKDKEERRKRAKEEAKKKKEAEAKAAEDARKAAEAATAAAAAAASTTPAESATPTADAPAPTAAETPAVTAATTTPAPESVPPTAAAEASEAGPSKPADEEPEEEKEEPPMRISSRLPSLNQMWEVLSDCLQRLGRASDPHAVLALQPAAEAFFLVHAMPRSGEKHAAADKEKEMSSSTIEDPDTQKLVEFAEKHRDVLNQVLRQNSSALSSGGAFGVLIQFPKLLDFDVKRKFFRKELSKVDGERSRRGDINVQVRRSQVFSDSFRELLRLRPAEWKNRFYIVFQGEEGQDAGGLLREWFSVITREIFNPNYALFITAPGDMVTYMINKASYINPEHLDYFKFVGRLIAKAIYDNKLLDCYFTRAFYKHILNIPVRYQDIESEDPAFYKSLDFLLQNPIDDLGLDLTFSLEVEEFGVRSIRDLKPEGRTIDVTDANKEEYVKLVCQMKMTGSIRKQLDAFLSGFYEVIPKTMISMFNEQELELLISGLPDVDIDDLSNNTDYRTYTKTSPQIQWFWRALRSFEPEDRAKFLQFVTGTSKVPLQGFASLEGMNGVQKFSIHMDSRGGDRLPAAHTCFNQLDLPQYESYEKLRDSLLTAIRECTEGFGFA